MIERFFLLRKRRSRVVPAPPPPEKNLGGEGVRAPLVLVRNRHYGCI